MEKIVAIIPAYNEEDAIGSVVSDVKKHLPEADVVVINDGSADLTVERAKESGAFVLDLPYNLGIGGAVQTGYRFADEMGYDIAIRFDGFIEQLHFRGGDFVRIIGIGLDLVHGDPDHLIHGIFKGC